MDPLLLSSTQEMTEKIIHERRSSISSTATEDSGYSSIFRTVNSLRVYNSKHEYLIAMIEDLAIWIQSNHSIDINVDNFFDCLETGVILCQQAQTVQTAGDKFVLTTNNGEHQLPGKWSNCTLILPAQPPRFQNRQTFQKFISRDNVANFIGWMRSFGFNETLMFETEDLISRKNIRHVVLALLELARVGGVFGLNVPSLVELEQEIDAEILSEIETQKEETVFCLNNDIFNTDIKTGNKLPRRKRSVSDNKSDNSLIAEPHAKQIIIPKPYFPECDMRSLDDMVRDILLECECKNQFPMTRLSEGKYFFGERNLIIFVRILRSHVMVRVGGGWDTLNHLLYKHDPCRKDRTDGKFITALQLSAGGYLDAKMSSNSYSRSNAIFNPIKKKSTQDNIASGQSSEIEEICMRVSNIPSSYSLVRESSTKIKRRSSLQLPRRTEMVLKAPSSKIPVLCRNLKVITEVPLSSRQADSLNITDTNSAPCSRHQSPVLIKRQIQ